MLFGLRQAVFEILVTALALLCASALGLLAWRHKDNMADLAEMDRLRATQPETPAQFSLDMVEGLPEPAQRYFRFSIVEGTPLYRVAEIEMVGTFMLGTKKAPQPFRITAFQVLAAPDGFIWKMTAQSSVIRMSGSDSGFWTRFWLAGLLPVARFGGDPDHARSAFGRYVAEAIFWTPAALLGTPGITWEKIDDDAVRMTLVRDGLTQSVDITVGADGRPTEVVFPRWSNANPDKVYRLQPFGGVLSEFRDFEGFRLPTHVEAGNFFGTKNYFAFFIVDVTRIRFPTGT